MVPTAAVSSVTPKSGRKTAQAKRDKKRHKGLAEVPLQIIDKPAVPPNVDPNDLISIENMTLIGSYSWVDSAEPTILVPGSPPVWRNRPTPYTLAPDKKSFVYEDAYRMPRFPNLARMRAIDIMTKEKGIHIDWPGIDFITDRNALRKLLKWASGSSGKEFRIDLELVGERMVCLNRWEPNNQDVNHRRQPGYGHRFELESTRAAPGCGGTTGHHRISSYTFGGLKMIVSYEVDACTPTSTPSATRTAAVDSHRPSKPSAPGSSRAGASKSNKALNIVRAGYEVPQDSLIELKSSAKITWTDTYPQLYFGQIPYLYRGIHDLGKVRQIVKRERTEEALLRIDGALQANIRKLRDALRIIQTLVVEHGRHGRLTVLYEQKHDRRLEVYRRTSQASCLPPEILRRFETPEA